MPSLRTLMFARLQVAMDDPLLVRGVERQVILFMAIGTPHRRNRPCARSYLRAWPPPVP